MKTATTSSNKPPSISKDEFRLLRDYIEKNCGISVGDEKTYLVETRLSGLLKETGAGSYRSLYDLAVTRPAMGLRDKLVDAMTTNETLWFRDTKPFDELQKVIFPSMVRELKEKKRRSVKIWSAACSTGQEPYSIVMTYLEVARKIAPDMVNKIEITATDISRSAMFIAISGRYDQIAMKRGMNQDMVNRYFKEEGRCHTIKPEVKEKVKFKSLNLKDDFLGMGNFDIVFMRNVAIYFKDDFKVALYAKLAKTLNKNGSLFLGSTESVTGNSDLFARVRGSSASYFTRT